MTGPLLPGTETPDLSRPSTPDQRVAFAEFRGQAVILAFLGILVAWAAEHWKRSLAIVAARARATSTVSTRP